MGEWPYDFVALLAEQNRQLGATQAELRKAFTYIASLGFIGPGPA